MQHKGWEYTLNFDIQDFFDSVTHDKVADAIPRGSRLELCDEFFPDGAARQGLPTSPLLAVLSVMPMTAEIDSLRIRGRLGIPFMFTIYADDIAMSFSREATATWLLSVIPPLVERHGFKINPAKTKLQCARAGRRMITGVAVDNDVHAPRYIKRKVRAAKHRMGRNPWSRRQHAGLSEWSKLVLPRDYRPPSPIKAAIRATVRTILRAPRGFVQAIFGRRFA